MFRENIVGPVRSIYSARQYNLFVSKEPLNNLPLNCVFRHSVSS